MGGDFKEKFAGDALCLSAQITHAIMQAAWCRGLWLRKVGQAKSKTSRVTPAIDT